MIKETDQEFAEIRKILKGLQEVKAPGYFETDLKRKINSGSFPEEAIPWYSKIFLQKKFIPSAALAVLAVIILFVLKPGSAEIENPFNTEPKIRKDLETTQIIKQKTENSLQQVMRNNEEISKAKTRETEHKSFTPGKPEILNPEESSSGNFEAVSSPAVSGYYEIDKSGLNFKQINLSKAEQMEINKLKKNLMKFLDENKAK